MQQALWLAVALCEGIGGMTWTHSLLMPLCVLCVAVNDIQAEGAKAIAQALRSNSCLTSLNLEGMWHPLRMLWQLHVHCLGDCLLSMAWLVAMHAHQHTRTAALGPALGGWQVVCM